MVRKIWQSSQWRKKRDKAIDNQICEWCGTSDNLLPHHTHKTLNERYVIEKEIIKELIKEKIETGVLKQKILPKRYVVHCPFCNFKRIKQLKLKKNGQPIRMTGGEKGHLRYQCEKCKKYIKFSPDQSDKFELIYEASSKLTREEYLQFIERNRGIINDRVNKRFDKKVLPYGELQDCIILCNRCHFAFHKGLHLCPKCKKNYASLNFSMCISCFKDTPEGKEYLKKKEEEWKFISDMDIEEDEVFNYELQKD